MINVTTTNKLEEVTQLLSIKDNEIDSLKESMRVVLDTNMKSSEELNKEKKLREEQGKAASEGLKSKDLEISLQIKEKNLLSQQVLDKEKEIQLIQQNLKAERDKNSQTLETLKNTEIEVKKLKISVSNNQTHSEEALQLQNENDLLKKKLININNELSNVKKENDAKINKESNLITELKLD